MCTATDSLFDRALTLLACGDLKHSDISVLVFVARREGPTKLDDLFGVVAKSKTTLRSALARLVDAGLISRAARKNGYGGDAACEYGLSPQEAAQQNAASMPVVPVPSGEQKMVPYDHDHKTQDQESSLDSVDSKDSYDHKAAKKLLVERGLWEDVAANLARKHPYSRIKEKCEMVERLPRRPGNVPGWIAWAIREDYQCRWLDEVWSQPRAVDETPSRQDFSDLAQEYNGDGPGPLHPPAYEGDPQGQVYWDVVYEELRRTVSQGTFNMWLMTARLLRVDGNTYTIGAANAYVRDWLAKHFKALITKKLSMYARTEVEVDFQVTEFVRG